ncbi:alpha/beta hydrolase [Nocardia amamiensis]|uniref:alpha/beta hydrolase n=1 Tax=Nocardia amamiensis TaxID=404578 RepID=UPI0033D0E561
MTFQHVEEDVSFRSGDGECRGWLYRPAAVNSESLGLVVLAHGFGGTHLSQYGRRAQRIVESGCAVLDFDPRGFGGSPGAPRGRLRVADWIADLEAAVCYARSLPDIDPERIGLFGSSLGGGLALEVAARDSRIAAVDVIVPLVDGLFVTPGTPVADRLRSASAVLRDLVGRRFGRPPIHVPAVGLPGSGALIAGEADFRSFFAVFEGVDGIEWVESHSVARHSELGEWRNDVSAAELIALPLFRPGRRADRIKAPLLAQIASEDRVAPAWIQRRLLSRAPHVEFRTMPIGHFDSFSGEWFDRSAAVDIDFFGRTLATK